MRACQVVTALIALLAVSAQCQAKESLLEKTIDLPNARPKTQSAPAGTSVDTGFSPNEGAEELVLRAIDTSVSSIRLAAYSFTSRPIVAALLNAKKRGVDVQCVLDKSNVTNKAGIAAANILINAGIPTRIDSMHPIQHSKYIVVNNMHVETGSFNYSANARSNSENVIVLWNVPALATRYTANWNEHWQHSSKYTSSY